MTDKELVSQPDAALIGVAILKANWDLQKKDYVENFVPIVAEALRLSTHEVVSLPELSGDLLRLFGLRLPQNQVRALLPRVAKRGYIRLRNGVYYRDKEKLATLDFASVQAQVTSQHEAVVSSLRRFAKDEFDFIWSEEAAEAALHIYLQNNRLLSRGLSESQQPLLHEAALPGANFIVGKFVEKVRAAAGVEFKYLETVVKGNILATAIFLSDPSRAIERFKKTFLYLDTSVLLYAMGHAGPAREAPARDLLGLLHQAGADLRAFTHTLDEIRSILIACAIRIETNNLRDSYGPSMEYFLARGFSGSDIRLLAGKAEEALQVLRVKVVDKPPLDHASMIDEAKLAALVDKHVGHDNPNARLRDVASISGIIRLREGKESVSIENSGALLVTTNAALARAAREFVFAEGPSTSVPPCVTDQYLSNIIWLKMPMQADGLPRKKLIAACFAATRPDDRLWNAYLKEIGKLEDLGNITTEDYYLLRHSLQARDVLMDVTLGEEEAFTEGTVQEVLETVKRNIAAEAHKRLTDETKRRVAAEKEAEELRAHFEALKHEVAPGQIGRAAAQEHEIATLRASAIARLTSQRAKCAQIAARVVGIVKVTAVAALTVGTISTFPWELPAITGWPWRYCLAALQFSVLIMAISNAVWGTTVMNIVRRLEIACAEALETMFGVAPDRVHSSIGPSEL